MAAPIKLSVIGTGLAVERLHWPALKQLTEEFTFTAFCDVNVSHAEHFTSYSGADMANFTRDWSDLLSRDDVDAVLISLPIPLQAQAIIQCLEAGKHVISEKPPGAYQPELPPIEDVAAAHPDQVLLIAENYFYRDDVRTAKYLVESGAIGRVHMMDFRTVSQLIPRDGEFSSTPWRWQGNYAGGPHLDAGVHDIAKIRMLMGDVSQLSAMVQDANSTHGGPSDLAVTMQFVNTAIGTYAASYPDHPVPPEPNDMRLYGTQGVLALSDRKLDVHYPDRTESWDFKGIDGGYYGEFRNFYEAIAHGAPVVGTLGQSIRGMEIVTKALESAATSLVVPMDEEPGGLTERPLQLWLPMGQSELDTGVKPSVKKASSS